MDGRTNARWKLGHVVALVDAEDGGQLSRGPCVGHWNVAEAL
jgi:hypothetical protein